MSASTRNFSWEVTSPGRWERDIDEAEQFYTSLAKAYEGTGRTFFAMTGFISLSVPVEPHISPQETRQRMEEALQKAWIRLRYDHPTIGSRVIYNLAEKKCKKVYETFSATFTLQNWLKDTFRVVENVSSGLEWCNSDPPVPALPTLFLIRTPSPPSDDRVRADLVLRAQHYIIDGMGTLMLFNNLFAHAGKAYEQQSSYTLPQFGDEYTNLSPPLRVAASIPPRLQPQQEERMQKILAFNSSLRKDVEIASPPFNKDRVEPGKHQRVAITLSKEQTGDLLDACRNAGLSITHAYHTAIALALRDVQERRQNDRQVRYINYSLINERGDCNSPYNTPAHPASAYHSVSGKSLAIDLSVPGLLNKNHPSYTGREFKDIAQKVREFYLDIRDDKEHIFLVPSYWDLSIIPYPVDGKTPPVPARNETPSVSISSLGVLDKVIRHKHGSFELEDPWVTGEELGTGLGLFLGTWKDRLTLSAAYNDAWHERDAVIGFLERCNRITLQELCHSL